MMTDRGQETFQLKVNLEDPSCNLVMEFPVPHTLKVKLSIIQLRELFCGGHLIKNAKSFSLYWSD